MPLTVVLKAASSSTLVGFLVIGMAHAQIKILNVTNAADYTNTAGVQFEIPTNGGLAAMYCTGLAGSPGTISAQAYPLPVELAGISVDVFGVPAPILGIAFLPDRQQINIQIPWEAVIRQISGVLTDSLEVRQSGQYDRIKVQSGLGIGRLFLQLNGYGIAQHASDYSPVTSTSPAHPGEAVIVYATGLGQSDKPQHTGYPPPPNLLSSVLGPVDLVLAGTQTKVLFEGLAPGLVGVNQINFQVPPSAPAGDLDLKLSLTETGCPLGPCQNGQAPQTVIITSPSVIIPVR
jgi:uncharacterized protein (TIGR03437 family)